MQELQNKLEELIVLRESYMARGRNEESLNDEIRFIQAQIRELKTK